MERLYGAFLGFTLATFMLGMLTAIHQNNGILVCILFLVLLFVAYLIVAPWAFTVTVARKR